MKLRPTSDLIGLLFVLFLFPLPARAQEADVEPDSVSAEADSMSAAEESATESETRGFTLGAEVAYNSAYAWRGIAMTEQPVVEPSIWTSWRGLTFLAWGQINMAGGDAERGAQSAQFSLSYALRWGGLELEPGLELFVNRTSAEEPDSNTSEGSVALSYRRAALRVFCEQTFDLWNHKGATFGRAGFGLEDTLGGTTTFSLAFYGGWASSTFNETYIGADRPAFYLVGVEGSMTWHLGSSFYIAPRWTATDIADRGIRAYLSRPTVTTVGIAVGIEL